MTTSVFLVCLLAASVAAVPGGAGGAAATAAASSGGSSYGGSVAGKGTSGGVRHGAFSVGGASYGGGVFGGFYGGPSVPIPYNFDYGVNAGPTVFGQREKGDGRDVSGTYFVNLPDGRRQRVDYVADATGYHATVSYQGTALHPSSFGVGFGSYGSYGRR